MRSGMIAARVVRTLGFLIVGRLLGGCEGGLSGKGPAIRAQRPVGSPGHATCGLVDPSGAAALGRERQAWSRSPALVRRVLNMPRPAGVARQRSAWVEASLVAGCS